MKKVILNGFNWFVNIEKKILFEKETDKEGISFKFLTESEKTQIYNQIHYGSW